MEPFSVRHIDVFSPEKMGIKGFSVRRVKSAKEAEGVVVTREGVDAASKKYKGNGKRVA